MNKSVLTRSEYEKIIHFAVQTAGPVKDVRLNILQELSKIFGYDETIFWCVDDNRNIIDPVIYRLREKILFDYLDTHQNDEIMHLQKYCEIFVEKKVLRVTDIITIDQYKNSVYYQSFMKPHGFDDVMSVALIYKGRIIGIIGIARKKEQLKFTKFDYECLRYLSNVIASVLAHQFNNELDYSMLSKREEDVVKLLKEGKTNQSIASELHVSINTVKKHLQHIYQKNSVQNRTQLLHKLKFTRK